MDSMLEVANQMGSTRAYNSAFSGFCVSTGKLDVYLTSERVKIHDVAPFVCIVKEAGGKITYANGEDINIRNNEASVVMSNGIIHDQIIAIIDKRK